MNCATRIVYRTWGVALTLILLGSGLVAAQGGAGPAAAPDATMVVAPAEAAPGGAAGTGGAASVIGLDRAEDLLNRIYALLAEYGLRALGAIVMLLIGRWVAKLLSSVIGRALTRAKVDPTLIPFIENLGYTALLVFVVIAALAAVGVQTASVVAVLGAAGLAVGLALQGSLANFASGVLLLVFKPFRVGDFVEIGGVKGTVQAIHVFNTVLNRSQAPASSITLSTARAASTLWSAYPTRTTCAMPGG
jgi:hypothetical protein